MDVTDVDTSTTVLGTSVAAPILVAPVALQQLAHADAEAATARAAARAGTIMVLSTSATMRPGAVAAAAPDAPRWFQVYVFRDRGITQSLIDEACEHGYSALVLTVDVPILGRREGAVRIGFHIPDEFEVAGDIFGDIDPSVSWRDLEWIAGHGLPVVLKGVLTTRGREARRRARRRGRRRVQSRRSAARRRAGVDRRAAPRLSEAVDGRAEVLLDSGVRRGVDVLRALALGARAVLVGRPIVYALAAGGEEGVAHVLQLLREEVELGLRLLGCTSPCRGDAGARRMDSVILARHGESIFSERGLVNGDVAVPGPLTREARRKRARWASRSPAIRSTCASRRSSSGRGRPPTSRSRAATFRGSSSPS